jgi:pimeloyl-ACP methyl ester carboxylesterase
MESPEVRTVDAKGTRLSYVEAGSGPKTIVFVHGSLDDYRSWRYQIEPFASRYRVIAYSRRYHYPNPWPANDGEYSAEIQALDLAAFIEALARPPVHLVTSSYGGNVGLYMTSQRPDLVSSIVLGEPPLMPWLAYLPGGKAHSQRFLNEIWYPARQAFSEDRLEDGARLFLDGVMGRPTMQLLGARGYQMIMDNAPEMRAESLASEAYFPPFTCAEAQAITQPVLLCKGELSPEIFHLITDELAKCLPGAQVPITIPGASHPMHIGNPRKYNELVLDFLQHNDANHGLER